MSIHTLLLCCFIASVVCQPATFNTACGSTCTITASGAIPAVNKQALTYSPVQRFSPDATSSCLCEAGQRTNGNFKYEFGVFQQFVGGAFKKYCCARAYYVGSSAGITAAVVYEHNVAAKTAKYFIIQTSATTGGFCTEMTGGVNAACFLALDQTSANAAPGACASKKENDNGPNSVIAYTCTTPAGVFPMSGQFCSASTDSGTNVGVISNC